MVTWQNLDQRHPHWAPNLKCGRKGALYKWIVPTILTHRRWFQSRWLITGLTQRDGFAATLAVPNGTLYCFLYHLTNKKVPTGKSISMGRSPMFLKIRQNWIAPKVRKPLSNLVRLTLFQSFLIRVCLHIHRTASHAFACASSRRIGATKRRIYWPSLFL